MTVRLERVYLANILLFIPDVVTIMKFPFVSKNCQTVMLTLKTNPAAFSDSPRAILKYFPNINTMVISYLHFLTKKNALPDTVTALVIKTIHFKWLTEVCLTYADRVVEIQSSKWHPDNYCDYSLFPRLERVRLDDDVQVERLPKQRLKCVRAYSANSDRLDLFPPECAELIIMV